MNCLLSAFKSEIRNPKSFADQLDASVLGAALFGRVVGDGLRIPKALGG